VLAVYGTLVAPGQLWSIDGLVRYGLLQQVYQQSSVYHIVGTAWTLSIEAAFYLSLPLLAAAIARLLGERPSLARHLAILAGLAVGMAVIAALVLRPLFSALGEDPGMAGFTLAGSFEPFAAGMALAILHAHRSELRRLPVGARRAWLGAVRTDRAWVVGAAAALAAGLVLEAGDVAPWYSTHGATVAAGLLFVPLVFRPWGSRLARALGHTRPLVALGAISYGLYLWHWPIQEILRRHVLDVPSTMLGWAVAVTIIGGLALVPAWLSQRFVERPLATWVHGRRQRHEGAVRRVAPVAARSMGASLAPARGALQARAVVGRQPVGTRPVATP
jgi:peptidoglycan/LPS O-acetylase OafA/YrhL